VADSVARNAAGSQARFGGRLLRGRELSHRETEHLRVLIANERKDRLALVAPIVAALGHEVIAREIEVEDVGAVTARERPDVALVGLGSSSEHALHLVEKIVLEPQRRGRVLCGRRRAPLAVQAAASVFLDPSGRAGSALSPKLRLGRHFSIQ
jgi:hypothetical protein